MKQVSEPRCYRFSRTGFNLPSLFVIGLIGTAYYRWSKRGASVYTKKQHQDYDWKEVKNHCPAALFEFSCLKFMTFHVLKSSHPSHPYHPCPCPVKNPECSYWLWIGYESNNSCGQSPRTFIKSRIHCFLWKTFQGQKGTNLFWFSRCACLLLLMAVDKFCSNFNGQKPYVEVSWNGGAPKSI